MKFISPALAITFTSIALDGAAHTLAPATVPKLAPPVKILAGGKPIAVDTGHAAPFVVDLDRDGRKDLIVGQFSGGKARVYRNVGTDAAPQFRDFTWLKADGQDASVPPS